MEENYKLEKEYRVPYETFKEAYKAYQKKFVRPKSIIFTIIFLILAGDFVYAAIKAPDNRLVYLLIMVCIALAFREWYNPKRIFRNVSDTVREMGEPVYKIGIAEDHIDISTVAVEEAEEEKAPAESSEEEEDAADEADLPEDFDPYPERSVLKLDEDFGLLEYERFFLLLEGKRVFYILPKEGFSEEELETVRAAKKDNAK